MLRSRTHILNQIKLREAMESRVESESEPGVLDEWDNYAKDRNRVALARLRSELSSVSDADLDLAFNGSGVYGTGITVQRLNALSYPLRRALSWTARDIMAVEGEPATDGSMSELAEPLIKGTFDGSFGLRVGRIPVSEQLPLGGETIFERATSRVVKIFQTSVESESSVEILDRVVGLRRYSISALIELSQQIGESEAPTYIRWKGGTVIAISPESATRLADTLSTVTASEENRRVRGLLQGGDLTVGKERFHLVPQPRGDADPEHYRGTIAPSALSAMNRLPLGSAVVTTVQVIYTESPLLPAPRETYVLMEIDERPLRRGGTPIEPEQPSN